ncbi:MAG TPA: HAD family hydrolase [Myxococcaceae bacterium]|jgi:phosphoglycolate phosphatase-like HAD superfamily hydrolase|nr:HAD family hydrolase [Myxococcaceae bacterium]
MRPTILLFDVDGTLVTTGGVGRRALELAFERAHGRRDACSGFRFDGMTDRAIVRGGLAALGREATPEAIDALLALYLEVLAEEVAAAPSATYRVHAGMEQILDAARGRGEVAVGLGTGNIREGARIKLERVGLFDRFAFGGFGCDHEDRPTLLRRGAERGAGHLGVRLGAGRVVVIGDTPKDVLAARAIGAESVAVATGSFTVAELAAAGATHAFATLAVAGALEAVLQS